jgi:PAS domain S-box-containing protein
MDSHKDGSGEMSGFAGTGFFRDLVEQAPDAIFVHDTVSVLYANRAAAGLFGADSPQDLEGRDIWSLIHPEERGALRARSLELLAGDVDSLGRTHERRIVTLDGRTIHIDGTAAVIPHEGRRLIAVHLRNASQLVSSREEQRQVREELARQVSLRTADMNQAVEEMWREVQARRDTEGRLRDSENRFRTIFELVNLPMTLSSMEDGRFVEVNSEFCRAMGKSRDEILGRTMEELQFFHDPGQLPEILRALDRDGTYTGEVLVDTALGVRNFLEWVKVFEMDGRRFLLAAANDVTDSRRALEALRESEEKYKFLVETTATGYVIVDGDGRILDANPEYVRLTGHRDLAEILGRSVTEWTAPHDRERNATEVQRCVREGSVRNLEVDYVDREGRLTPVEINANLTTFGNETWILGLCRDISSRRQAEAAIKKSEERFRTLLSNAPIPMSLSTMDGVFVEVNDEFSTVTGYAREEVLGRTPVQVGMSADAARLRELLAVLADRGGFDGEPTYTMKDGSRRTFLGRGTMLRLDGVPHVLVGMVDITERRKMEQRLRESEESFRAIFQISGVALTLSRVDDGTIVLANDEFLRAAGRAREEVVGRTTQEVGLFRDPDLRRELLEILARDGRHQREIEVSHPEGVRTFLWSGAIVDIEGVPHLLGASLDITSRQHAEAKLRASEEFFRAAFQVSGVALSLSSMAEGRIVEVNDEFLRVAGLGREEVIGRTVRELNIYPDPALRSKFMEGYLRDGKLSGEYTFRLPGGEVRQFLWSGVMVDLGGKSHLLVAATDITERRVAEIALAESEDRFRTLTEQLPNSVLIFDLDRGGVSFANRMAEELIGIPRETLMGPGFNPFALVDESFHALMRQAQEVHRKGGDMGPMEMSFRTPSGAERQSIIHARPIVHHGSRLVICVITDITERRRMETSLRESEERYRAIVDNSPFAFIIHQDGRPIFFNKAARALLGYESADQAKPLSVFDMIHADDRAMAMDNYRRRIAGETIPLYEVRLLHRDGSMRHVRMGGAVFSYDGRPAAMISCMDITAVREAERALRDSEERFRTLAEELPAMVFINQGGRVVYANQKSVEAMGYTLDEFTAAEFDFLCLIAPESRGGIRENFARHARGEDVPPYEYRLVTRAGGSIDAVIHTRLIDYSGRPAILGIVTDITELKKAQEAVLQSEENLRRIVESSPLGILVHEDGVFVAANPASVALLRGNSERDILGRTVWSFVEPGFVPLVENRYDDLHQGPRSLKAAEYRIVLLDGSVTDVEMISQSFPVGDRLRVLTIMRDISDRKAADKVILEARRALERQNEELRALDRIRETIIRDVSHELKTPIAKQQMQLQLLRRMIASWGREGESENVVRVMKESLARQETAIRNILDLARLESGGRKYTFEPVSLAESVREVLAEFDQLFDEQGVEVRTAFGKAVIASDREMLWHVFSNIVSNAVKFRRATRPRIDIEVTTRDGEAVVTLADNGIGLSPEAQERVFDRFFKVAPSSEGSGIGLSLVRKIVHDLGGRICVESAGEGLGTTVTVWLPLEGGTT